MSKKMLIGVFGIGGAVIASYALIPMPVKITVIGADTMRPIPTTAFAYVLPNVPPDQLEAELLRQRAAGTLITHYATNGVINVSVRVGKYVFWTDAEGYEEMGSYVTIFHPWQSFEYKLQKV